MKQSPTVAVYTAETLRGKEESVTEQFNVSEAPQRITLLSFSREIYFGSYESTIVECPFPHTEGTSIAVKLENASYFAENKFCIIAAAPLSETKELPGVLARTENISAFENQEGGMQGIEWFRLTPLHRVVFFNIAEATKKGASPTAEWRLLSEEPPSEKVFATNQFKTRIQEIIEMYAFAIQGVDIGEFGEGTSVEEVAEKLNLPHIENPEDVGCFLDVVSQNLYAFVWLPEIQDRIEMLMVEPKVMMRMRTLKEALEVACDARLEMDNGATPQQILENALGLELEIENAPKLANDDLNKDDYPPEVWEEIQKISYMLKSASSARADKEVRDEEKYMETLIEFPWKKRTEDRKDLSAVGEILDADHDGLKEPKDAILEALAMRKLNPDARNTVLCFVGPPGTGKTSLAKSIARALGRKFVRMSLGGVRDEAEIRGHRRTYVSAMPGGIVKKIMQAGVINPVFVFDEIDKLDRHMDSGPEDALLEAFDPEQNACFEDHYLEFGIDLSQVIFITTANMLENISRPLRDRMQIIKLPSYSLEERVRIAQNHLLPDQIREVGLDPENLKERGYDPIDIRFSEGALRSLAHEYTREAGVRELERKINVVLGKLTTTLVTEETLSSPVRITRQNIHTYLGAPSRREESDLFDLPAGVAVILAYTPIGGVTDFVEVSARERPDGFAKKVDGNFPEGDESVIKKSVEGAITRLRHGHAGVNFPKSTWMQYIHVRVGSLNDQIDGPSAGIGILNAIYSEIVGCPIKPGLTMTGALPLKRIVGVRVGGVREKILAAHTVKMREVMIPRANEFDLEELPQEFLRDVKIVKTADMSYEQLRQFAAKSRDQFTVYVLDKVEDSLVVSFAYRGADPQTYQSRFN